MSSRPPLNIFFASAASLLTDTSGHGEGLIAWNMISELARRGHTVTACADEVHLEQAPSFEIVVLKHARRLESVSPYTRPWAIWQAYERRHKKRPYDICHWLFPQQEEEVYFRAGVSAATVLGPLPFPWKRSDRSHGLRAGDFVRAPLTPLLRRRFHRQLVGADALIASLPEVKDDLADPERSRAAVVGFGIWADRYNVTELPPIPTVGFIGRLIENKQLRTLYRAFLSVTTTMPDARLVIVGDGPLRSWLDERVAADGVADRVRIVGPVAHSEVPALLSSFSLLCLPSDGEPFGMVLLEAMAAGRAVVAVGRGGPKHFVRQGENGLLVRGGSIEDLAIALERLLGSRQELQAIGARNRAAAESRLSWASVVDDLEDVYYEAIERRQAGRKVP